MRADDLESKQHDDEGMENVWLESTYETPFNWTSFTETFKSSIRKIEKWEPIVKAKPNALINLTRFMI